MKPLPAYLPKTSLHRCGATLEEATDTLHRAVADFLREFEAVPNERLHAPVAPDRWSPAEYADHLVRSTALYTDAIRRPSDGRPPLAYERGLLREDGRLITVPDAEPEAGRDRRELVGDLLAATDRLVEDARRARDDGRLETVCMQNPFFHDVTVLEVVQLAAVHARRHTGHIVKTRT